MQNNEKHWRYFRHIADELCKQHQLDVIENPKRGTGKNYYARKLHEAGMPNYVDSAKAVIDEAISKSNSYADFKYILRQMGASFDDSPNHKYQVLRVKGYQKNIRLTRLGDEYSLDRIKERIYENRNRVRLEPFQKGYYYRPKQYVLLTREHKIRKVGGLYGLYLHYCYKLGYLPKYQKQNPARLHYLLRGLLISWVIEREQNLLKMFTRNPHHETFGLIYFYTSVYHRIYRGVFFEIKKSLYYI